MLDQMLEVAQEEVAVANIIGLVRPRSTEPAQVVDQAGKVVAQLRHLLPPRHVRAAGAMNEHERRAIAMELVVDVRAIGLENGHVASCFRKQAQRTGATIDDKAQ